MDEVKTTKPRRLSKKQKGFIKDYVATGNGTQAALNHYDVKNENVARSIASENLTKPAIMDAILSIAEQIPDELLVKVHNEGLEATEGLLEQPDYAVRHKYLDSAYKLKGAYAAEKHVTVNVEVEASDRIKKLAEQLKNSYVTNTMEQGKESNASSESESESGSFREETNHGAKSEDFSKP